MTQTQSCSIRIANKPYNIKCPEGEIDNLKQAALKLNGHLVETKKKFKHLDEHQALLLAALHLSHELITCQAEQEQRREHLNQFIQSLENKISQAAVDIA